MNRTIVAPFWLIFIIHGLNKYWCHEKQICINPQLEVVLIKSIKSKVDIYEKFMSHLNTSGFLKKTKY